MPGRVTSRPAPAPTGPGRSDSAKPAEAPTTRVGAPWPGAPRADDGFSVRAPAGRTPDAGQPRPPAAAPAASVAGTSPGAPQATRALGDFEKTRGVWMHALLRDSPYARTLEAEFGRHVGYVLRDVDASRADPSEFWTQDWSPKRVQTRDGLKLVGYLSVAEKRSAQFGTATQRDPVGERSFHPSPYKPVISSGPPEGVWARHELLPLVLEGGNVVTAGGKVFVSEKVLQDNARDWAREHGLHHLGPAGYRPRGADEVRDLLAGAFEVGRDDVVVLPAMPGERTAHVDMFMMPLADGVVAVPEIRDDAFEVVGYPHERELGRKAQQFLDQTAQRLESLGLQVKRLPMMPPVHLEGAPQRSEGYEALYATPTQSTLFQVEMDGAVKARAFVPTLRYEGFGEAYQRKAAGYTDEVKALLDGFGYSPRTYDAQDLFTKKGGGHCVSVPAP